MIDAIIITANGDESVVTDGVLYLDKDKMIKWKSDEEVNQKGNITNITISEIVNWPIKNDTNRPSR